jgi:hypothetical protein
MHGIGKSLILLGCFITLLGVIVSLAGKVPWLGRLPGDIFFKRGNITFYLPLATSVILSLLVSLVLWLLRK